MLPAHASPTEWQIAPSTCFTNEPGEPCRLEITVTLPASVVQTRQEICFVLQDTLLRCVRSDLPDVQLTVQIAHNSTLRILVDGQEKASKILLVQSLNPANKRRRVRNPWSLF